MNKKTQKENAKKKYIKYVPNNRYSIIINRSYIQSYVLYTIEYIFVYYF